VPCYRCGTRQADPEPGKPSPYQRGVVAEHQVLICPACQPAALAELTRCPRCGGMHLIRRLDQIECLDCRLMRDVDPAQASAPDSSGGAAAGGGAAGASGRGSALAAEVAKALERLRGTR
jgi:hypothetical protein